MKTIEKTTFLTRPCHTLFSCSNVEKKAGERPQTARAAFERGDYSKVKMQIDSIKILYPKAFETRREGIGLMQQVELKEQEKTLAYPNSMLQGKQEAVDAVKGNYAFGKGAEYRRMGNYLRPSQVVKRNLHYSYLHFQVDEDGVTSMTSIYCGPYNIHHLAVKATAPDDSFTGTLAPKDSYETTDLGEKIEKTDYKIEEDSSIVTFFNPNKDKNIRVSYLGERPYATTMTLNDRGAVAAAHGLAQLLSAIIEIKKNRDETNLKIEFTERKMAEREGGKREQVLECRPSTLPL